MHGTFGDSQNLLQRLTWSLDGAGYCVFALDYGNRATGPIEDSAAQLKTYVDRVLAATGAAKVSMVGHSQGGMMPRYYIKFLGGASKVDDLVGLAPSNHGTSNPLLLTPGLSYLCPSCLQQKTGSTFLTRLNAGDETPGPGQLHQHRDAGTTRWCSRTPPASSPARTPPTSGSRTSAASTSPTTC